MTIRPVLQRGNGQSTLGYTAPMPVARKWLALTLALACGRPGCCPAQTASASSTSPAPGRGNTPLGVSIDALLRDPAVARAHWGIAVTELDGTPVFSLDEGKLFRPASTAKLFTAAAAMTLLGPESVRFTRIYGKLDPATGVIHGDLTILGGGDPSFGTTDLPYGLPGTVPHPPGDLNSIVGLLTAKGVHRIAGNIVADDTLFATEDPPEGWESSDLMMGYGALPSALSFADNEIVLTVRGGSAHLEQLVPYMSVQSSVTVETPTPAEPGGIGVQRVPGHPNALLAVGTLAPGAPAVTQHLALPDPARYAAEVFRAALSKAEIRVSGTARSVHTNAYSPPSFLGALRAPGGCESSVLSGELCDVDCPSTERTETPLVEHSSAPLRDEIAFTLKTSANLHAEVLLHELAPAFASSCTGVSEVEGARMLRAWLLHIGLLEGDFFLYDGSGLSTKDLVTPRAEAQLLAYAVTQPWFGHWKTALPVGGVDGTLAARFTDAPLKGHVFAKTGTLGESRALAGYVGCASGKELIFAILVDNHEPGTAADRETMDKIVAAIAAKN